MLSTLLSNHVARSKAMRLRGNSMRRIRYFLLAATVLSVLAVPCDAQQGIPRGKKEPYDWREPMRVLAKARQGDNGKILRLGDSITYANPGSAFLRYGK